MAISKQALRKLRKRLPDKFMEKAQTALHSAGRSVSDSYISQVVNGHRFDQQILEVLADVADKHQAGLAELEARIVKS